MAECKCGRTDCGCQAPEEDTRIVMPLRERNPNAVNRLRERIHNIQESCDHDFRLLFEPVLIESLVEGVYIGRTEGPVSSRLRQKARDLWQKRADMGVLGIYLGLQCLKCSKDKETTIEATCPRCLSPMRQGQMVDGLTPQPDSRTFQFSREYYFGKKYIYYAIRLYHCTKCNFTLASDEWNQ